MELTRNSTLCNVEDIPKAKKRYFNKLINSSFAKDKFYSCSFGLECNTATLVEHGILSVQALNIFIQFCSTLSNYLSECSFYDYLFTNYLPSNLKHKTNLALYQTLLCIMYYFHDIDLLVVKKHGQPSR